MKNANHRITLQSRHVDLGGSENFAEDVVPTRMSDLNEVLVESLLISTDPAMRVSISENPGSVPQIEIGKVMRAGDMAG